MRRYPHRIIFRLTDKDFQFFGGMIHKVYGVHNWSDLCRHALYIASEDHQHAEFPLGSRPTDNGQTNGDLLRSQLGHTPPAVSDHIDEKEARKIFRNLAKRNKPTVNKRLKAFKKKLDKRKPAKVK